MRNRFSIRMKAASAVFSTATLAVLTAPAAGAANSHTAAPQFGTALTTMAVRPFVTQPAAATAGGLSVFVGYAEDKEINTPNPAAFPVPWAGSPNTTFLGGTVPGQGACGTLTVCYDAGAIRLDNPGTTPITVSKVSVDMHSSIPGGKLFGNLWGSFTVQAGQSVILTENPPTNNPGHDNFDTSGYPSTCTPITVAPTVTITVAGVATTLADTGHVLDTGGIDPGSCSPKHNESNQWQQIGSAGTGVATLALSPATVTQTAGQPVTETATLLDGTGLGVPNAVVTYKVTSGPDTGWSGSAVTDSNGQASFSVPGAGDGEDVLAASVTTVGTITTNQSRVMWTDGSPANWNSADIANPALAGSQGYDPGSGNWTVSGAGTGLGGTSDQFHFAWRTAPADGGIAAHVIAQTAGGSSALAGVMLRASTDPGAPYYAALTTSGGNITITDRTVQGGSTATVATVPGSAPGYLWIVSSGTTLRAYQSADGYDWLPVPGSTVSLNLGPNTLAGLAVTGGDPAVLNTATMNAVALSAGPPGPAEPVSCPAPWTCADIGSPTPAGSQSFDPNTSTWTINAGGADITGTSDQFRYAWQTLTGDGSVIAYVASQTGTSSGAKAGVMFRTSTDPGAPNYAVVVTPGQGIKVQVRQTQGGGTTKLANPAGAIPTYLKITRSGSTFTAYTSTDGITWTLIPGSTITLSLGTTLLAGLAVTSHNSGALCTVVMNSVAVG
jgi:hypothetical protein